MTKATKALKLIMRLTKLTMSRIISNPRGLKLRPGLPALTGQMTKMAQKSLFPQNSHLGCPQTRPQLGHQRQYQRLQAQRRQYRRGHPVAVEAGPFKASIRRTSRRHEPAAGAEVSTPTSRPSWPHRTSAFIDVTY